MPEAGPILLLPGLGADTRMFDPLRAAGLEIQTPRWIDPHPRESLAEYAARLADGIAPCPVVGGASLGGMLALELAGRLRARTVVLLGSCSHPGRLAPGTRLIERLSQALPTRLVRTLADTGFGINRLGPMEPETRTLLLKMVHQTPVPFLRWGARAIVTWPGIDPAAVEARQLWIHGDRDRLIRPPLHPAPHYVRGAGHVLSMTHPQEVARLLQTA